LILVLFSPSFSFFTVFLYQKPYGPGTLVGVDLCAVFLSWCFPGLPPFFFSAESSFCPFGASRCSHFVLFNCRLFPESAAGFFRPLPCFSTACNLCSAACSLPDLPFRDVKSSSSSAGLSAGFLFLCVLRLISRGRRSVSRVHPCFSLPSVAFFILFFCLIAEIVPLLVRTESFRLF